MLGVAQRRGRKGRWKAQLDCVACCKGRAQGYPTPEMKEGEKENAIRARKNCNSTLSDAKMKNAASPVKERTTSCATALKLVIKLTTPHLFADLISSTLSRREYKLAYTKATATNTENINTLTTS